MIHKNIIDSYLGEIEELSKNLSDFVDVLVTEALRITGNLEMTATEKGGRWRPAGKIRLWDDSFGSNMPLEGVKVRARRWFVTHTGITNSNGDFSCNGRFRRDANYSIEWERYDFLLRDNFGHAKYNGPKKKGDWNLDITGGTQKFYATIFKAAHHYYHLDILGLRRPPQNSFWHTQLKIRANYEDNGGLLGVHHPGRRFLGLGTNIEIWNPDGGTELVYATTIHELAHASHWNMDQWHYNNSWDIVAESWASGVEWALTSIIYPEYELDYFDDYTGVVEDMLDGRIGYDQVSGYTIREIEDSLIDELYWDNWRINIENLYNNGTENNLEALFDFWE